jgi:hypothetical protein
VVGSEVVRPGVSGRGSVTLGANGKRVRGGETGHEEAE